MKSWHKLLMYIPIFGLFWAIYKYVKLWNYFDTLLEYHNLFCIIAVVQGASVGILIGSLLFL